MEGVKNTMMIGKISIGNRQHPLIYTLWVYIDRDIKQELSLGYP